MIFILNKKVLLDKGHTSAHINLPPRFEGCKARIEITIKEEYCEDEKFVRNSKQGSKDE